MINYQCIDYQNKGLKSKQTTLLVDETKTSKLFDLVFSSPALIVLHRGTVVVKASIHIIRVRQRFVSVFKERVKANNTTVVTEGFTSNCDVTLPCTTLFLSTILLYTTFTCFCFFMHHVSLLL